MPSDPFWTARRPGARLTWTPSGVDGDRAACAFVEEYLATHDDVLVTATGPSVPATMEHPAAVYVLVARLWTDATFSGDVPDLAALLDGPEGAAF